MTVRNILLFLHIATAILVIGGLTLINMVLPGMVRGGREYLPALRKFEALGRVFGPTSGIVFLLGIALVVKNKWHFNHAWLSSSMLLFIIASVISAVPVARTLQTAISKIDDGHPVDAEASRLGMLGGIVILIVLVIVYLMVAKPGGVS
jgi:uncharacterized membrane protein